MYIPFKEPISPRYIHINPVTNKVHLMVPVVGGQEISTDNTCQATAALEEFFLGGALRELIAYANALIFDIGLLGVGSAQRIEKEERLAQIKTYFEAVRPMRSTYSQVITNFLRTPSNLYSIQLRPQEPDSLSNVVNPAFNVNRAVEPDGTPLSSLYNELHGTFPTVVMSTTPRTRLTTAVLNAIPESASFADIQQTLGDQCSALFGLTINFTQRTDGTLATKEAIDSLMGFGEDATPEDYIDALLGACALDVWDTLPTPPFYSIPVATPEKQRTERLSLLTQFFLANLNVYCKARGLSDQNFGVTLDESSDLSHDLASLVSTALMSGDDVERALCNFFNINADTFGLSRVINADDLNVIRQTFERNYRTITATQENPHMDDFMILDKEATGETARFVTHQGSICVNFAEIIDPIASRNPDYFESIRADFIVHPMEVPHRNESVASGVEIDVETLLLRIINDEQFESLPTVVKETCRAHPSFQAYRFLRDVAQGKQEEAEALLTTTPDITQILLRVPGTFTDYSGRTFNCTACEYAYWAKDTHMFRMLEGHMNEETKAIMAARIDEIERIDSATNQPVGLVYSQEGREHRSAHFDYTPLKEAYWRYLDSCKGSADPDNWPAIISAWLKVGLEQRNVPAYVAQEYCRPDRSFNPLPEFNEATLPRMFTFYDNIYQRNAFWFPLAAHNFGLGSLFAITRGDGIVEGGNLMRANPIRVEMDLAAINRLDEVTTADLLLLREHLNPPAASSCMIM